MYEFKMPALGAEMTSGKLLEWKVKEGDSIKRLDIIAVIDTDKAAIEIESFVEGVVQSLLVQPGERVQVGAVLALIRETGEAALIPAKAPAPVSKGRAFKISPLARKMAEQWGIDPANIVGTGLDGVITEADIEKFRATTTALSSSDRTLAMQKVIGAAMARSKREIPHYYLSCEIDLNLALKWLEQYNSIHPMSERILYVVLLIKAVAESIKKFPQFNGFYIDDEFHPAPSVHAGIAIALRGGGLIAPALLNVDQLSLREIMQGLTDLVSRARSAKLKGSEMSDSTITITNLGELGVDSVFGVIYPPQVALIGFGRISPRNTIIASLAADHRVSNGHLGGRFLSAIQQFLQEPIHYGQSPIAR
ncbi:MAG TPA: dihydrolipoamide acetyltransferase family protein [Gammaproteobacteria bacterium]|nr:dihydrolipoamide acetyltransferase family protein [Gammaproteobacteria bacterium]